MTSSILIIIAAKLLPDLPPVASWSHVLDNFFDLQMTDTSTNSPSSWAWAVDGPQGPDLLSSTEQNPFFDLARLVDFSVNDSNDFDIRLIATNAAGSSTEYVDTVNVAKPPGDYVALNNLTIDTSGTVHVVKFDIFRARDVANNVLAGPKQVLIEIRNTLDDTVVFSRMSTWGDITGLVLSGTILEGETLQFDIVHDDHAGYSVTFTPQTAGSNSHRVETEVYERIVEYPHSSGGIGGGSIDISARIVDMTYSVANLQKWEHCQFDDVMHGWQYHNDASVASIGEMQGYGLRVFGHVRWDLYYGNGRYGYSDVEHSPSKPEIVNGAAPTAAMMGDPLGVDRSGVSDPRTWADAVTLIEAAGYTAHADTLARYGDFSFVKNPYHVSFDAAAMEYHVHAVQAKLTSIDWLTYQRDYCLAVQGTRGETLDGFALYPQKPHLHRRYPNIAFPLRLVDWLWRQDSGDTSTNDGWDLATNSGGPQGAWPNSGEAFDDPADSLWDMLKAWQTIVGLYKAGGATVMTGIDSLTSQILNNAVHIDLLRSGYSAEFGGTDTDADNAVATIIRDTVAIADYVTLPADTDDDPTFTNPIFAALLAELRALREQGKHVVTHSHKPTGAPQPLT